MKKPNDEILMAFADGQLSGPDLVHVKDYLLSDPTAQEFVAAMARTAELARSACNMPEATHVPPALLSYVLNAPITTDTGNIVKFDVKKSAMSRHTSTWFALAASIALVFGIASSGVFQLEPSHSLVATGPVENTTVLAKLLETHVSGVSLPLSTNGSDRIHVAVNSTFKDKTQRLCREVEVLTGAETKNPIAAAIACRTAEGRWLVEGVVQYASSDKSSSNSSYVPSGQESANPLDLILDRLGAQSALSADDEKILIDKSWN